MKFFLSLVLLFFVSSAQASNFFDQFTDPVDGAFDASSWLSENAYGFLPMPIVITEPALGTGGGLVGLFFHEDRAEQKKRMEAARTSENAAAYLLPPSVSAVAAAGTSNGSWFGGVGHMGFWKGDSIRYTGYTGYGSINLDFYGTREFELQRPLELNTEGAAVTQKLLFKVADSRWYMGVKQNWVRADVAPENLNKFISDIYPPGMPPEIEEKLRELMTIRSKVSGLGFSAQFDSRNNVFSPRKGYNYELDYLVYDEGLGSDYNYDQLIFEGLNYWSVAETVTAALRVQTEAIYTSSFLPFFVIPGINMRGIPAARYQGNRVVVSELEANWDITPRWAVLGFVGAGRTAASSSDLDDAPSRISQGMGFRYNLARRYGFYGGVDVARGPEETAWYIQAGSSW